MSKVAIVCDSTCDLGPEWLEDHDVVMVPLTVFFGEEAFLDWVELRPEQFYKKLESFSSLPKTSQPSPAAFLKAYTDLSDVGYESVVVITLTSKLSGTWQSASIASEDSPIPVHLIDTLKVTQATGLVIRAAVEARDAGGDAETVAQVASRTSEACRLFFVLDTLEYLVKGGRAGKAQGLAASLLQIKPVLEMNAEGIIEPFKKVKGLRKAIQELAAHVAEEAEAKGRLRVALLHACAPDLVETLREEIEATGADIIMEPAGLVGAVIGTYAGPRAVGVAYYPISD